MTPQSEAIDRHRVDGAATSSKRARASSRPLVRRRGTKSGRLERDHPMVARRAIRARGTAVDHRRRGRRPAAVLPRPRGSGCRIRRPRTTARRSITALASSGAPESRTTRGCGGPGRGRGDEGQLEDARRRARAEPRGLTEHGVGRADHQLCGLDALVEITAGVQPRPLTGGVASVVAGLRRRLVGGRIGRAQPESAGVSVGGGEVAQLLARLRVGVGHVDRDPVEQLIGLRAPSPCAPRGLPIHADGLPRAIQRGHREPAADPLGGRELGRLRARDRHEDRRDAEPGPGAARSRSCGIRSSARASRTAVARSRRARSARVPR